ncbi:MAG TPA: helix-turn-helix domain-containing protein, partial [Chloroflexota bacterium]
LSICMAMGGRRRRVGVVAIRPDVLRAARVERGLTQQQVAEGIVSAQGFAGWETGRTRPLRVHLERICERLGISIWSVLADTRDPREPELARLESKQDLGALRHLASEMLADLNVRAESNAVARFYYARSLVTESPRRALAELRRAHTLLSKRELHELAAHALDWQAVALYYLEDPAAINTARRALDTYRSLPDRDPTVESRMHEHMGTILLQWQENEAAVASYRESRAGTVDVSRLAIIYHGRAMAHRRLGDTRNALEYMERAVHMFRARDDSRGFYADCGTARAENTYAWYLLLVGDWTRAEEMIRASLGHFEAAGVEDGKANALLTMGELRHAQGQYADAGEWIERAIALAERLGAVLTVSKGYQQLGELWALQGEQERTEAAFSRAVEILAEHPEQRAEALERYRRLTSQPAQSDRHA